MCKLVKVSPNEWRGITEQEKKIVEKILKENISVHDIENCFCDKHNNLYFLTITSKTLNIYFVRSKVLSLNNSHKLGFYEPEYPVYESITELFNDFPKKV